MANLKYVSEQTETFTIAKRGVAITIRTKGNLDEYGNLILTYQVERGEVHAARDYRDGVIYFYTSERIADQTKVDGVRIEDSSVVKQLDAIKFAALAARDELMKMWTARLIAGQVEGKIIEVGYDDPHLALYPPDQMQQELGAHTAFSVFEKATGLKVGRRMKTEETYIGVFTRAKARLQRELIQAEENKSGVVIHCETAPRPKPAALEMYNAPPSFEGRYLLVNAELKPISADDFAFLRSRNWLYFLSSDDLEEFDMFYEMPGWRLTGEAVSYLAQKNYKIIERE